MSARGPITGCQEWITYGIIGPNSRTGGECGQPVVGEDILGRKLCRLHLDIHERSQRQFEEAMDRASQHHRSIAISGKGVHCHCGLFVPNGINHPWGLPSRLEKEKRAQGLVPCPACCYRFEHPDLTINCGSGCDDGWVPVT